MVMITELMPESLVLLADELCLPLRNMVSVEKKERKQSFKVTKRSLRLFDISIFLGFASLLQSNLTSEDKEIMRKYQGPEEFLYNYFLNK